MFVYTLFILIIVSATSTVATGIVEMNTNGIIIIIIMKL